MRSEPRPGAGAPRVVVPLERLLQHLRCPVCASALAREATALRCGRCAQSYADTASGQLDLRPRGSRPLSITATVDGRAAAANDEWPPLAMRADPAVDLSRAEPPVHISRELLSWFPRAADRQALALDLGCGAAPHRGICEEAGFTHVGVDYEGAAALVLADAHCLPFAEGCVDFVLSVAVLEHVRHPLVFLREVARVLRPGGTFIGTVAFLEPFHAQSYYHHTHLAVLGGLEDASLDVLALGPVRSWPALRALGEMALFPPLAGSVTRLLVSPLQGMHRLWWALARAVAPRASDARRRTWTAGAFEFVAKKPDRLATT